MSKQTDMVKTGGHGMQRPGTGRESSADDGGNASMRELDESTLNDPNLINTVEGRLKNLHGLTVPDKQEQSAERDEDEDDPTLGGNDDSRRDAGDHEPGQAEESEDSDDSTLNKEDSDGDDSDGPALPEAYVRCAVGWGWKEKDVVDFFKRDPDKALATLSNMYVSRNRATAQFAALGQSARQRRAEEKRQASDDVFKPIPIEGLREKFGDDAGPLIDVIDKQNKMLAELSKHTRTPEPEQGHNLEFGSKAEESTVESQIHGFFETDGLKQYEKLYGKLEFGETWDDLSPAQRELRWKVLDKADQIIGGAHLQNIEMPLNEALESAHLLVTQKYRDQVLVDGVKAKVIKRGKAITLKPSDGTKRPGTDPTQQAAPGTRSRQQLESDVGRRLSELYG